jgi:hypothetical protein
LNSAFRQLLMKNHHYCRLDNAGFGITLLEEAEIADQEYYFGN